MPLLGLFTPEQRQQLLANDRQPSMRSRSSSCCVGVTLRPDDRGSPFVQPPLGEPNWHVSPCQLAPLPRRSGPPPSPPRGR